MFATGSHLVTLNRLKTLLRNLVRGNEPREREVQRHQEEIILIKKLNKEINPAKPSEEKLTGFQMIAVSLPPVHVTASSLHYNYFLKTTSLASLSGRRLLRTGPPRYTHQQYVHVRPKLAQL